MLLSLSYTITFWFVFIEKSLRNYIYFTQIWHPVIKLMWSVYAYFLERFERVICSS